MKTLARQLLGPVWPMLVKARSSDTVRAGKALLGYPAYAGRRRAAGDRLAIDLAGEMGLGATLSQALLCHAFAETQGLAPAIVSSNPLYADAPGEDFLASYFDRPPAPARAAMLYGPSLDWAFRRVLPRSVELGEAARLFARHFPLREDIARAVEEVMDGRAAFQASIHYRGTDKALESGHIHHDTIFAETDRLMAGLGPQPDIFLATDDQAFEQALRRRYDRARFTTFNLGTTKPGEPRHFSALPARDKAREALLNILLIARAPLCVRTSSYLSAVSRIVNPAMRTRTVNLTLKGSRLFPECEVLAAEQGRS